MKYLAIILSVSIGLCACSDNTRGSMQDFIPGTYVREVSNEMSIGKDTLQISFVSGLSYRIIHSGEYQRIQDGKLLPREHKIEKWMASYDEKEVVLNEAKRGRVLSFDPSKRLLYVGSSPYQKIGSR